ncbi:transporter substrate-binding domain-containing protein [Leeia aquatica]|uniref:Transporter substrate-binding domain-containing protein n=1 Tax=Leeia aquatica TaxID=2725557 RepID=A0A847SL53_9NEIS|nr:transporter substrate-binding domain-containing protein [Leeia aquatica]NLR76662.1 transporter substrate-binding domain-containing protein [Leeia aquatica]
MKYFITLLTLFMFSTANSQTTATLKVGIDGAFPPYSEVLPDGSLKGFDVDIAKAICSELKRKCDLIRFDFDGMIPALSVKKLDMLVASMAITEERKKKVSFSDKYEGGYMVFYGRKDRKMEATPLGMKGKVIGVIRGSVQESYIKAEFASKGVRMTSYDDAEKALMDLAVGRTDAIFIEIGNAIEFKKRPSNAQLAIFGPKFDDKKYFGTGSGIAVRKEDRDLLIEINKAIAKIRTNGVYKSINDKYFEYDQYE